MGTSERTRQPAYNIWAMMKQRCSNPRAANYGLYGGRGVTVCNRWVGSYDNFVADMGQPPRGMTLERKDNEKGYYPDNCVWASAEVQCNNKRNNVKLTYRGETLSVAQWTRKLGFARVDIIHHRISAGYTIDKILEVAVKAHTRRVRKLTLEGAALAEFESMAEAGRSMGRDQRALFGCLSGRVKSALGFKWEYIDAVA